MTASVAFSNTSNWEEAIYVFLPPGGNVDSGIRDDVLINDDEDLGKLRSGQIVATITRIEWMRTRFPPDGGEKEVGTVHYFVADDGGPAFFRCDLFDPKMGDGVEGCDPLTRDFPIPVDMGKASETYRKAWLFACYAAKRRVRRLNRKESMVFHDFGAEDVPLVIWAQPVPRGKGEYLGQVEVQCVEVTGDDG